MDPSQLTLTQAVTIALALIGGAVLYRQWRDRPAPARSMPVINPPVIAAPPIPPPPATGWMEQAIRGGWIEAEQLVQRGLAKQTARQMLAGLEAAVESERAAPAPVAGPGPNPHPNP
jgi:hypothetical protein